ncbi:MAG: type I-E CRISPR-associated protein Cse1/CasA [Micropruina sp.]|nr:type I-E CRISPR-associated protein Cse1/CasA [Micropruina sp.]
MSFAEAARWLIHCQAFDPAGIKTGALGDPRVKAGKGYSFGYPAWSGNLGLLIAEGRTLRETLLLNLPLYFENSSRCGRSTHLGTTPSVERRGLRPCVSHWAMRPLHVAFPTRTPLSRREEGRGRTDFERRQARPQNQNAHEPMNAWRFSEPQSKKAGHGVVMPVVHQPDRMAWQGLGPMLSPGDGSRGSRQRPWCLTWLHKLVTHGVLTPDMPVRLRTLGVVYGTQNSVIDGLVSDVLDCRLAAITDPEVIQTAVDAAEASSRAVDALVNLASNLNDAAGGDREPPRGPTRELVFSALNTEFRPWLSGLGTTYSGLAAGRQWQATVRFTMSAQARRLVHDAGAPALVGRDITPLSGKATHLDASLAHLWFSGALRKALPLAFPDKQPPATGVPAWTSPLRSHALCWSVITCLDACRIYSGDFWIASLGAWLSPSWPSCADAHSTTPQTHRKSGV